MVQRGTLERGRRAAARGGPDDGAKDCGIPDRRQGTKATRKQAIDLQAAILAALRKRNGTRVIGDAAPARWRLKEAPSLCR